MPSERIAQTSPAKTRAEAVADAQAALRTLADALPALLAPEPERTSGPRLVGGREPEVLLTMAEACALFPGKGSRERSLYRLAEKHPEILRRIGAKRWFERGALLRVTRG